MIGAGGRMAGPVLATGPIQLLAERKTLSTNNILHQPTRAGMENDDTRTH
jgi:hypothetical protein